MRAYRPVGSGGRYVSGPVPVGPCTMISSLSARTSATSRRMAGSVARMPPVRPLSTTAISGEIVPGGACARAARDPGPMRPEVESLAGARCQREGRAAGRRAGSRRRCRRRAGLRMMTSATPQSPLYSALALGAEADQRHAQPQEARAGRRPAARAGASWRRRWTRWDRLTSDAHRAAERQRDERPAGETDRGRHAGEEGRRVPPCAS